MSAILQVIGGNNMVLKYILLISICLLSVGGINASASDITVMTFNLRVPIDPPPHDWPSRLPLIIKTIHTQRPDFLGVQEVTPAMLKDLRNELPRYGIVGRGREVDSGGEGTQILFLQNRWVLDKQDQGTLQLSSTPEIPGSNDWNMSWPRIFTWVHLREKNTGKFIYVFNTHFPLAPAERDLSVRVLAKAIATRKHPSDPVILTGDFNACEVEASMKYLLGNDGSPLAMHDTFRALYPADQTGTFHGFGTTQSCKIDYIYTLGNIKISAAGIIKETKNFSSDHYPVTAKLRF